MLTRWPIYDRAFVHIADGSAIDGILVDRRGPLLVLADCTLHTPNAEPTPLDGQIFIERDRILFIQVTSK